MSIFVDESTRVVYQGLTGSQGRFYGLRNRDYGTNVVAGTNLGREVDDTLHERRRHEGGGAAMTGDRLQGRLRIEPAKHDHGVAEEVRDVVGRSGEEVVHADDFVTLRQEALAEVRADEPRSSGDQRTRHRDGVQLAARTTFRPIGTYVKPCSRMTSGS